MGFFDILGWVIGELESLAQWVVGLLIDVYNFVLSGIGFIWNTLVSFAGVLSNIFHTIADFFDDLWWSYIVPFVEKVQQIFDDISTWLANFLDPLITFLKALNDWFTIHILPYLKIVIEVIQRMRVILAAFRIMGFQWAAKLDADLQKIQGYVTLVIQDVVGTLNKISTVINLAIDPAQIIRVPFFNNTLFSSLGAVKRAAAFGSNRPLTATEQEEIQQDGALLQGGAAVATRNADGSVTYSPAAARINAGFDDALRTLGVTH